MNDRNFRTIVWALAVLVGVVFAPGPAHSQPKPKIVFSLSWIATGAAASFFVAKGKGFYDEEGLNVSIVRGYGSADTATRLAQGRSQLGAVAAGQVILSRSRGAKIKLVAMQMHKNPNAVVYRKDSGIRVPKDLEGKKVGGFAAGATRVLFPALAKANGIDMNKVKLINLGPGTFAASLAAGKVDALLDFITAYPGEQKAVRQGGGDADYMLFSDQGVSLYGNGIGTSDKLIQQKPDVVRRLVRATIRGMSWSIEHPKEAIDIFMKLNPQFTSRAQAAAAFEMLTKLHSDKYTGKYGLSYMVPEKVKQTMDIIVDAHNIKSLPIGEVYTNQFVEATPKEWRFPKPVKR